jgi:hypothetical protein
MTVAWDGIQINNRHYVQLPIDKIRSTLISFYTVRMLPSPLFCTALSRHNTIFFSHCLNWKFTILYIFLHLANVGIFCPGRFTLSQLVSNAYIPLLHSSTPCLPVLLIPFHSSPFSSYLIPCSPVPPVQNSLSFPLLLSYPLMFYPLFSHPLLSQPHPLLSQPPSPLTSAPHIVLISPQSLD